MNYFYLYIFLLFSFIVLVSYYTTYIHSLEGFNSNKDTFVLLGDSIIKNNAYISDGKSVEDILIERTNGKTHCYAADHSKIVDVYNQVSQIPLELNNNNTSIFLSAGGNDILTHYVDQEGDITDSTVLNPMFAAYKKLIESIRVRIPNAKIYLLDIYYPDTIKYKPYHSIISEWNDMIYNFANNPKNNISGVVKVSSVLTQGDDFAFGIEPSSKGGQKIAENILNA